MNRDELLSRLTALDFMAVDLNLYLDTHPKDKDAIEAYNNIIKDADYFRMEYEKLYGPLYSYRSLSKSQFHWVDDPWPWEEKFNYCLAGEVDY